MARVIKSETSSIIVPSIRICNGIKTLPGYRIGKSISYNIVLIPANKLSCNSSSTASINLNYK